ncbi:MAG: sigma-70 family RNA polymerase sigma factor [Candidatus Omnitrophota bacterium]
MTIQDDGRETLSSAPDEELMQRYAQGEVEAFDELFQRHKNAVYAFIYHFVRISDSRDDLFQNVFLRIIRYRNQYKPTAKFTTWLFAITRSVCIDAMRKSHNANIIPLFPDGEDERDGGREMEPVCGGLSPREALHRSEIQRAIEETIRTLPPEQREVLLLREKTNLTFEEIAEAAGCSPNTVKSRMHYALLALRKELRKRGIDSL